MDISLLKNPDKSRYEALLGDDVAGLIDFRVAGAVVELPHTEVGEQFGGQGIGSALVRFALDDLRGQGARVRPTCPFIAEWIERHPDYQDLLA